MPTDPTTTAALGLKPTYSAQEGAAMLGRSYSWLDQRLPAGQFIPPDGTTVQPLRTPGVIGGSPFRCCGTSSWPAPTTAGSRRRTPDMPFAR